MESIRAVREAIANESTVARWRGDEGPRWQVIVSPAAIKLRRVNYSQWNETNERGRESVSEMWHEGVPRSGSMSENDGMTMTRDRAKRSIITAWSDESRRRMSYVLKTLDYSPLFEDFGVPALVTLTMPANWEQIVPTPKSFKALLNKLRDRYRYDWRGTMTGVWKMEFQRRGAPHLHILMTPPTGRRPGSGETFSTWLAVTWAQICQLPGMDWEDPEQRRWRQEHELMGTSIDYSRGLQDRSPDGIAAYFSKHGLFGAKDYQNNPPEMWLEAVKLSGGVRFWGYWALEKAQGVVDLNPITPHYVK